LSRVDEFLGLDLGPDRIRQNLEGPLLRRHAKQPENEYNAAQRLRDLQDIGPATRRDIEAIVEWSYEVCRTSPRGVPLPNALIELDKNYLRGPWR
jgi:hypothetical protein